MNRRVLFVSLLVPASLFAAPATTGQASVTFHKDIEPLLQKNCQTCHRPGEAAPMSFLTWKETRPWAKAMKEAVRLRKMPPWFADPHVGKFANDRSLTETEIATLGRWADAGAPEGDPKDAPAARVFENGWNIGKPDMVVEMPQAIEIPAKGTIEYSYVVFPSGFTEDKWVRMAEVRPGNRPLVHHVIAFVRPPGSKWLSAAQPGVPYVPKRGTPDAQNAFGGEFLVGYAPGFMPDTLPEGYARMIPAKSDIVLQLHYTANGQEGKDITKVGFVFAKEPPAQRVTVLAASNQRFTIPAGADNHKVESKFTMQQDVTLIDLLPHMHLRGKAFEYRITYPDGRKEEVLKVPNYSFNWQLTYKPEKPIRLPKGTVVECTAWYDNSANNPYNPDPKVDVKHGEQSWEEMMFGFFNVAFDPKLPLMELYPKPPKKQQPEQQKETGED